MEQGFEKKHSKCNYCKKNKKINKKLLKNKYQRKNRLIVKKIYLLAVNVFNEE